jgi:hypothetical protein
MVIVPFDQNIQFHSLAPKYGWCHIRFASIWRNLMLTVGDTFPAFALKAVKPGPEGLKLDSAFTDISSDTDAGKWKLVFFWPKDFTFA